MDSINDSEQHYTNIPLEDFLAHGFRTYPTREDYVKFACQKPIRRHDGKLLFYINVRHHYFVFSSGDAYDRQDYSVQLYFEGDMTLNAQLHPFKGATPARLEEYYTNMFVKLGCLPDIHND
jgi:hypothetical protein